MAVTASTQAPGKTQDVVATVLGVPASRVRAAVTRIGGGFGGKETRSVGVSAAAAVGAAVTGRAVKVVLGRAADMVSSGTRHAFLAEYKVAYVSAGAAAGGTAAGTSGDDDGDAALRGDATGGAPFHPPVGRLVALSIDLYSNAGHTADLSIPVMDRALFHLDNAYNIPAVRFHGRACVTHTPSATAFRGFGGPQGMLVMENVVDHVARAVGLPPETVRAVNMYGGVAWDGVTSGGGAHSD
eukprot:contig_29511_g7242